LTESRIIRRSNACDADTSRRRSRRHNLGAGQDKGITAPHLFSGLGLTFEEHRLRDAPRDEVGQYLI
jgi:hypothetical protein